MVTIFSLLSKKSSLCKLRRKLKIYQCSNNKKINLMGMRILHE